MKSIRSIIGAGLLGFVCAAAAAAQDGDLRVETRLVTLNVAVTDRQGNFVRNLDKSDFTLFDGGTRREIEEFSAEAAPIHFGIVYDMHPSSDENTRQVLDALRGWLGGLSSRDSFFLTVFNERGSLTTDFVPTADQIARQLDGAPNRTPKSLYDAIFAASDKVRERRAAKRVLLVLTDGEDHHSHHSLKELKQRLRQINLPLYAVAFHDEKAREWGFSELYGDGRRRRPDPSDTSPLDAAALADLSRTSGGAAFERERQNRLLLEAVFRQVQREVDHQYVLGFYPENADGKWRKLKVGVKAPAGQRYRLKSRKGYLSPARAAAK